MNVVKRKGREALLDEAIDALEDFIVWRVTGATSKEYASEIRGMLKEKLFNLITFGGTS